MSPQTIEDLTARLTGKVVTPADPCYEEDSLV